MSKQFTLTSPDIANNASVDPRFEFNGFGCNGQNQSPVLDWSDAPVGTKSFALTVYDPDAPTGSGWWHWFVVDIPADVAQLAANAGARGGAQLPEGARHVRNDYGLFEFGGFCPPPGDKPHRYVFTLHALSVGTLDIPDDASCALAGFMVNANTLAKFSFTGTYGRAA
ncbi:YbhB/YbcL family Raf kinase inhibitor-like protein [Diaphorobacter aerolatus]|uniref:YbhB/YbcL family Raf kinase inhibitor-like protein n=1 Tax=Diaphorobacter aerolatus TaxID=1288495 RepID=A0A7H0GNL3_9BURK|nr:YbhB/YbcL family Raf kinase inhibitor-like protein [Diaphorobacter aerolatus]QNP49879.1 YbhB/YbcL family Raf kinase inhibitor-like protein [Diaphorobacter aerolatus]